MDADTKLIIAYHVGLRAQEDADALMLDCAGQVLSRVQLTTEGHPTYLNAVENAFGLADVDYAQLVKIYGPEPTTDGPERKYSPGRYNGGKKTMQIALPA